MKKSVTLVESDEDIDEQNNETKTEKHENENDNMHVNDDDINIDDKPKVIDKPHKKKAAEVNEHQENHWQETKVLQILYITRYKVQQ